MTNLRDKVKQIIFEELKRASITASWDMREIHVLPESKIVIEYTSSQGDLSQALIDHYFPPIHASVRRAHFTSLDKFRSIALSRTLRLYSLLKRVNEEEFKSFSEDFGLTGYLDDTYGEPYYITLMRDLYYVSFTDPEPMEKEYMWNFFGERGNGVKIVFDISVVNARSELRPVIYSTKSKAAGTLVKRIMDRIQNECNRYFIMRGISRVGAFYLPLGFNLEKERETRLLVKCWGYGPAHDLVVNAGVESYIPLKIGDNENQFCKLKIVEVQVGKKCDKHEVLKVLKKAGLSTVKIIEYA